MKKELNQKESFPALKSDNNNKNNIKNNHNYNDNSNNNSSINDEKLNAKKSDNNSNLNNNNNNNHQPHPLSVINNKKKLIEKNNLIENSKINEIEIRKNNRKKILLETFNGKINTTTTTNWRNNNNNNENINLSDLFLNDFIISENDLLRPLYPLIIIIWARKNLSDVLKIEQKIDLLLSDNNNNNSVQLKPMNKQMRDIVHAIAKYYYLNSYEYDYEPKRYVSLGNYCCCYNYYYYYYYIKKLYFILFFILSLLYQL